MTKLEILREMFPEEHRQSKLSKIALKMPKSYIDLCKQGMDSDIKNGLDKNDKFYFRLLTS